MPWISGDKLSEHLRKIVLKRYIYRMTTESMRANVEATTHMLRGGYRMPIVSDSEWLSSHAFYVTKKGELSIRHNFCKTV